MEYIRKWSCSLRDVRCYCSSRSIKATIGSNINRFPVGRHLIKQPAECLIIIIEPPQPSVCNLRQWVIAVVIVLFILPAKTNYMNVTYPHGFHKNNKGSAKGARSHHVSSIYWRIWNCLSKWTACISKSYKGSRDELSAGPWKDILASTQTKKPVALYA